MSLITLLLGWLILRSDEKLPDADASGAPDTEENKNTVLDLSKVV